MTALLLGWRLATSSASRVRSTLTLLATALGALLLLTVAAVARAEIAKATGDSSATELHRLLLAVIATIGLPLGVLVATVSRLSASLRDRRLANLRLIGLTPGQTRTVAAAETGSVSALGTLLGWGLFWLVRPLLADRDVAGRSWDAPSLMPTVIDQIVVLVCLPALTVLLAALPQRSGVDTAMARARRADRRPPSLLRLAPILVGVGLCSVVVARGHQETTSDSTIVVVFVGVALTGVGMVLVVPVFVRLVAAALLRFSSGPTTRIAARRLEAQPAGVTRVIAALLIGLFVATGARFVVTAFESTPQFQTAAANVEDHQRVLLETRGDHQGLASRVRAEEGVDDVVVVPRLSTGRCGSGSCWQALVVTCDELHRIQPELRGCREDEPMWLDTMTAERIREDFPDLARSGEMVWKAGRGAGMTEVVTTPVVMKTFPAPSGGRHYSDVLSPVYADVLIPPSMVGELPDNTVREILVVGPPGRTLADHLAGTLRGVSATVPDFAAYDLVLGLRALVWTVAGVVLAIGLLAFAVAAIDRAIERRSEMVALQLVGVPSALLRRAQWVEALVPIVIGSAFAVALGALAGATYLTLDTALSMPWGQTAGLAGIAAFGGALVAGLTVIASAPRIRADRIRRE